MITPPHTCVTQTYINKTKSEKNVYIKLGIHRVERSEILCKTTLQVHFCWRPEISNPSVCTNVWIPIYSRFVYSTTLVIQDLIVTKSTHVSTLIRAPNSFPNYYIQFYFLLHIFHKVFNLGDEGQCVTCIIGFYPGPLWNLGCIPCGTISDFVFGLGDGTHVHILLNFESVGHLIHLNPLFHYPKKSVRRQIKKKLEQA